MRGEKDRATSFLQPCPFSLWAKFRLIEGADVMRDFCRLSGVCCGAVVLILAVGTFPAAVSAQEFSGAQAPAVLRPLITQPVDESHLTVLKGNTHPLA